MDKSSQNNTNENKGPRPVSNGVNSKSFENLSEKQIILSLWGILVLLLFLLLISLFSQQPKISETLPYVKNPFDSVSVEARSAIVFDIRNQKIIYAKDDQAPRPLASIAKLMTTLVASKELNKDSIITITRKDIGSEGDSGLRIGEKISFQKIIDFTLTGSSNDGASAIATAAVAVSNKNFSNSMNTLAREIGLNGLLFENSTGLDGDSVNAGSYGTARDVAKLLAYIVKEDPSLISATRYQNISVESEKGVRHNAKNTNNALPFIPGLIGGKTGYTLLSQGNLAIAFDPGLGSPYTIVVLGSSEEGRFEDVKKLVGATLLYIEQR